MVDGELCSNLGSKRDAVELMSRDMQGCIPAEGVIPMLPCEQLCIAVAGVGDAVLVEVVTHVHVCRVEQSCGGCVCGCACSDSVDMRLVCMRRSRR